MDIRLTEFVNVCLTQGALVAMVDHTPQRQHTHITLGMHFVRSQLEVVTIASKGRNLDTKKKLSKTKLHYFDLDSLELYPINTTTRTINLLYVFGDCRG